MLMPRQEQAHLNLIVPRFSLRQGKRERRDLLPGPIQRAARFMLRLDLGSAEICSDARKRQLTSGGIELLGFIPVLGNCL